MHADVPRSPTGEMPEGAEGVTEAVSPTGLGRVGVTQLRGCCAEQRSRDTELLLHVRGQHWDRTIRISMLCWPHDA